MGVTFRRGQELNRKDGLSIYLKTKDGGPSNAANIHFSIYDFTTGTEVLLPPPDRVPANPTIGEFYAPFVIDLSANVGLYRIRWRFNQYINSKVAEVVQEFSVVDNLTQVITVPGVTPVEHDLIRGLRIMLRDGNPARNYKFLPPTGEESINQLTKVFGYIWEDQELLEFLRVSNDAINMYPPQTFYHDLDQLIAEHRDWRTLLFTGAMVHAITALTLNAIADSFEYAIGGISLSIDKGPKYQAMASDAQARFAEYIVASKETVKVIRGLRQSRYGIGLRSSFGPNVGRGALTPRRFLGI